MARSPRALFDKAARGEGRRSGRRGSPLAQVAVMLQAACGQPDATVERLATAGVGARIGASYR